MCRKKFSQNKLTKSDLGNDKINRKYDNNKTPSKKSSKTVDVKKSAVLDFLKNIKLLSSQEKLDKGTKLLPILENVKKRLSKGSEIHLTQSQRQEVKKFADEVRKNKNEKFLGELVQGEIKKKFSLTKSKNAILKDVVEDFKAGHKLSEILKESNLNLELFDKNEMNKFLNQYKENKEKKNAFMNNIDDLKKKLSLTKSRAKVLDKMKEDYKARKVSSSVLPNMSKMDLANLKKEDLNKILDNFKENHMQKPHVPFIKQSKFKQWKSDIKAKLETM